DARADSIDVVHRDVAVPVRRHAHRLLVGLLRRDRGDVLAVQLRHRVVDAGADRAVVVVPAEQVRVEALRSVLIARRVLDPRKGPVRIRRAIAHGRDPRTCRSLERAVPPRAASVEDCDVKTLATLAAVIAFGAQSKDASLTQTQGDDGLYRVQISVHYGFPGLPPRTNNSGVGTVRVTLPDGNVKVDSVETGYQCATEGPGPVICQNDGQPQEGGTAFPPSMTLNLISQNCLSQSGTADVW